MGGYITLMQDVNNRRYYGGERYIGTLYFLHDVSVNCPIDNLRLVDAGNPQMGILAILRRPHSCYVGAVMVY